MMDSREKYLIQEQLQENCLKVTTNETFFLCLMNNLFFQKILFITNFSQLTRENPFSFCIRGFYA